MRLLSVLMLCAAIAAAAAPQKNLPHVPIVKPKAHGQVAQQEPARPEIFTFRTGVTEVSVPATVMGPGGDYLVNLEPTDFTLTDNDVRQQIKVRLVEEPISLVVLVGISPRVGEKVFQQVRKLGVVFSTMLLGEQGEAAVIAYDHRIEVLTGTPTQPFTHNADDIEKVFTGLKLGSDTAKLSDAMVRALSMLANRPDDRRKVIVAIGEDRDNGSETSQGYVLREAQLGGILVYSIGLSKLRNDMMGQPQPSSAPQFPPGAVPGPANQPPIPQPPAANIGALIAEAVGGVKGVIFDRPMDSLAKGTGAVHISAKRNRDVDEALSRISAELHKQYIITYRPNNLSQPGFHNIKVTVDRPVDEIRAKPGYFFPGGLQGPPASAPPAQPK